MIQNKVLSIQISNLLSFGEDSPKIELGSLNVIIGPNGSGKSNLIEVLNILRSTAKDFAGEIADSGGIEELLWKGGGKAKNVIAKIQVTAHPSTVRNPLHYLLSFTRTRSQVKIVDEKIENDTPDKGHVKPYFYFDFSNGRPILNVAGKPRALKREDVDVQKSILSQRQDPEQYPELTYLGRLFASFRLYRNWDFGPDSWHRDLYSASQRNDFLEENASNLGIMLNRLRAIPEIKLLLLEYLQLFYAGAQDILTPIQGGMVDLRVEESGGITIPASRLSDGTLRWLSLLAIFLNPDPPPLICVEEPELGLHPDIIPSLAQLLRDASERMQIIVTTHSTDLIDALSDDPKLVIICEKHRASTSLHRLDAETLEVWLRQYSLGQLWRTGEIGGNRW